MVGLEVYLSYLPPLVVPEEYFIPGTPVKREGITDQPYCWNCLTWSLVPGNIDIGVEELCSADIKSIAVIALSGWIPVESQPEIIAKVLSIGVYGEVT